ncbi:MAG: VWA domain-containing protein [Campylobacterota bacterium]|nr:VWA domain-containing protein [Campylobacterota bacterium]
MMLLNISYLWLFLILFYMYYKRCTKSSKIIYMYLSMAMVIIALSRPVFNEEVIKVDTQGSDVIIALDISYSMQAEDIKPNRLTAAKQLLKNLVKRDIRDRFGVIAYTTNAIILSPLTSDSELLLNLIERIDEKMVMTRGTSLLPALKLARKMSLSKRPKVLLLTDGGDAESYAKEAKYAKESGLQVNVLMMATTFGSTLKNSDGTLLKDDNGNIVVSSENKAIKQLSNATNGEFLNNSEVSSVISLLKKQYREDFKGKSEIVKYSELFYLFIIFSIVFFMLAYTTLREKLHKKVVLLLMFVGVVSQAGVLDFYYLRQAADSYENGAYGHASQYFLKVQNSNAQFNAGVASYKEGKYEKALVSFEAISSSSEDFKSKIYYNMALCYIRLKEFDKARHNLIKSLTLKYDESAYENYMYIRTATHHEMLTGQQKGKKRTDDVESDSSNRSKKLKEGGGSNMNVAAAASNSQSSSGMKTKTDEMLSFSKGASKLSSSQYELINQRSVSETAPW